LTRIVLAALHIEHPGVWCNTLARLDPIAGGALLAHALDGRVPSFSKWSRAAWLAGGAVALLGTGAVGVHAGWGAVATYPLAAVSALAILYATLGLGCANRSLLYLGKISFGLYVLHVAVLRLTEPAGPLAGLALTVVAAALSYRYLETPFLRLKERYALVGSRPL